MCEKKEETPKLALLVTWNSRSSTNGIVTRLTTSYSTLVPLSSTVPVSTVNQTLSCIQNRECICVKPPCRHIKPPWRTNTGKSVIRCTSPSRHSLMTAITISCSFFNFICAFSSVIKIIRIPSVTLLAAKRNRISRVSIVRICLYESQSRQTHTTCGGLSGTGGYIILLTCVLPFHFAT